MTLDNYCADAGIQESGLLRVDVEGHQLKVLKDATGLLDAKAIHTIQFDGGAAFAFRIFFRDFWLLLTEREYKIHRVLPFGLLPVAAYREQDEVCLPTIYLALR